MDITRDFGSRVLGSNPGGRAIYLHIKPEETCSSGFFAPNFRTVPFSLILIPVLSFQNKQEIVD